MRRPILALLACLLPAAANERPNILFIFSDDHALNAISAYGGPLKDIAPTPNLDRLAKEGMLFTRSFCANSICGPSRATVLTGKHSLHNGFVSNEGTTFDGSQTTFPKLLQKAGYQTAVIGKWHLVSEPTGFDHWKILPDQGSYYNPDFIAPDGRVRREGYCTDIITDLSIEWLEKERDPDRPFLLMSQHKAPHRNWAAAPRHLDLFDDMDIPEPPTLFDDYSGRSRLLKEQAMTIARHFTWAHDMKFHGPNLFPEHFGSGGNNGEYGRMSPEQKAAWDAAYEPENQQLVEDIRSGRLAGDDITRWKFQRYIKDYLRTIRAVDENVGRLLDYLDRSGLADNTIVVYSSDQGFYLGEHGWYDKRWMFEESLAMPLMVRWPGKTAPGAKSGALVQNIDYAPTFLDAADVPAPEDIHGRSLLPVQAGGGEAPAGWREAIYYYYSGENTHKVAAHDGVRTERHKLMFFPKTQEWNLFDLEKDPREMTSIHDDPAYAGVLEDMQRRYREIRQRFGITPATELAHRLGRKEWNEAHQAAKRAAHDGGRKFVFIGGSLVAGLDAEVEGRFGEKALNLGRDGDRTEHVLWRLLNGELGNLSPEAFVLGIGAANGRDRDEPPAETAAAIQRIVDLLHDRRPGSRVLLLPVPGESELNERLAAMADSDPIRFLPHPTAAEDVRENGHLTPAAASALAEAIATALAAPGR